MNRQLQSLYTEKTPGFVLRLPPQNNPHATLMQPLQCVLQHHVANLHVSTHVAIPDDNNQMQAFQCNLQPEIPQTHRTTHTHTTTPKAAWSHSYSAAKKTRQNERTRNRLTHELLFIAACSHFTRKSTRFRAPASSPKQPPCNTHAAITMRFAASRRKPARCIYAHGNTRWPEIPKHPKTAHTHTDASKAAWSHRYTAAKKKTSERHQPRPLHTRAAIHRQLQSLYTEKRQVSCSSFLPKTSPMQHSCSHYNAFCSITSQTCMYLRTWQYQMTTIMQPFQYDLQPQIHQETHRRIEICTHDAEHQGGTDSTMKRAQPHPPHTLR